MKWITPLLTIIAAVLGWFGFGKTKEPDKEGQAIDTANDMGRTSADVTRQTQAKIDKDRADAEAQTASDLQSVRAAGSVRNKRIAVADAVRRANEDT